MQSIDLDEWVEFEAMVEANGPSMILDSKEEIVFRGSEEKRTLEYVRQPAKDAKAFAEIMKNNPSQFKDAGFHAILPLAKSIEMHIRLLFLGEDKDKFASNGFQLAKALKQMEKIIQGAEKNIQPITGFQEKKFQAAGTRWEKFCTDGMKDEKQRLIKTSFNIYKKGNPYRHNKVKSWNEIEPEYQKVIKLYNKFIGLFDKIME